MLGEHALGGNVRTDCVGLHRMGLVSGATEIRGWVGEFSEAGSPSCAIICLAANAEGP